VAINQRGWALPRNSVESDFVDFGFVGATDDDFYIARRQKVEQGPIARDQCRFFF
jgi:hypothetical protein